MNEAIKIIEKTLSEINKLDDNLMEAIRLLNSDQNKNLAGWALLANIRRMRKILQGAEEQFSGEP
jgi:hypothetical protein